MFGWLHKLFKKKEIKEPKGLTLVLAGSLKDFEQWCKLNSSDLSQQYSRNVIDDLNIIGLPVDQVDEIVVTGKFWDNKMLISPMFRNFFREWERYNETKTK